MITFRDINYTVDIPEIIGLIKLGLSDKNTVNSFLWKHKENPFGISVGLLACDEEEIVGVRMFMFWEFRKGEKIVKAIRPVDTIIHPNYRGKGLFKKLTLEGLKICKNEYDLVFNTPNKNSFPGYIKMGWVSYGGRLNFKAAFVFPFSRNNIALERIPLKLIDINDLKLEYNQFRTHLTNDYLHWRYIDAVYKSVSISCEGKKSIIIYRIEKIKGIKILIINEIFGEFQNKIQAIRQLVSKENAFLIYYLENKFSKLDFVLSMNKGDAVVVYREDHFNIIEGISFSSGDLEGRL